MGRFLVAHPVGGNLDLEAATPVSKSVKVQCSAMAKDFETVPPMPVEGVYPIVARVCGEDFRWAQLTAGRGWSAAGCIRQVD